MSFRMLIVLVGFQVLQHALAAVVQSQVSLPPKQVCSAILRIFQNRHFTDESAPESRYTFKNR